MGNLEIIIERGHRDANLAARVLAANVAEIWGPTATLLNYLETGDKTLSFTRSEAYAQANNAPLAASRLAATAAAGAYRDGMHTGERLYFVYNKSLRARVARLEYDEPQLTQREAKSKAQAEQDDLLSALFGGWAVRAGGIRFNLIDG